MGTPFSAPAAKALLNDGAVPLLELEPFGVSMASIAGGQDDKYLSNYAHGVAALNAPVLMSFAPELNGSWYTWGYKDVSPAVAVAAWQHVVTLFRQAGAKNVRWIWIVNTNYNGSEQLPLIWPGSQYVDMVGLDGYFRFPGVTFASAFAPTLIQVRMFTTVPVMITETAANPAAGKARVVTELVKAMTKYDLAGFIWFAINQSGQPGRGLARADWSLTGTALAEYGKAVRNEQTNQ
jgi:hypothetical protein